MNREPRLAMLAALGLSSLLLGCEPPKTGSGGGGSASRPTSKPAGKAPAAEKKETPDKGEPGDKPAEDGPGDTPDRAAGFDHSAFDKLLKTYVTDQSRVDYAAWKAKDLKTLDAYLATVKAAKPDALPSAAHKKAFWINVYNAWTIRSILAKYPLESILDIAKDGGDFHVWKKNPITIDGKPYNLDTIEKQILLKDLAEPRAHFAVNCASIGCPPLKPSAWSAATLDEDFAANARTYFALPGNFSYDAASKTVGISQLFDWYKADFGGTPDKVQKALAPYVPNAEAKKLMESGGATLKYLDYNWKLNDAKGS